MGVLCLLFNKEFGKLHKKKIISHDASASGIRAPSFNMSYS